MIGSRSQWFVAMVLLALCACASCLADESVEPVDRTDPTPTPDAGAPATDAGNDAGDLPMDAGAQDAGQDDGAVDAGQDDGAVDAGPPPVDPLASLANLPAVCSSDDWCWWAPQPSGTSYGRIVSTGSESTGYDNIWITG